MENVNKQRRIFISLPEPEHGPLKYKFRRFLVHLAKQVSRDNRDKETERTQIHFLSDVLVAVVSLEINFPNDAELRASTTEY